MTENLTYEDILKAKETLNNNDTILSQWTGVYNMTAAERSKIVEEILLQPYMEDVYKAHNIEPKDVKEFIEVVKADRTASENVIFNNSNAFQQNKDNSKDMDGDGKGDGDSTKIDSYEEKDARRRQLIKAFEKIMKPFAVQKAVERMPINAGKSTMDKAGKLVKSFFEVGRVVVIAAGIAASAFIANGILRTQNNEKDNKKADENNVMTKADTQANNTESKVYTNWAQKHQNERL